MGKVERLHNRVEPFAALFWALVIVCTCQHLTLPAGPVSLHRRIHTECPYMVAACTVVSSWFNSQRRSDAPPLFLSRYVIMSCWFR